MYIYYIYNHSREVYISIGSYLIEVILDMNKTEKLIKVYKSSTSTAMILPKAWVSAMGISYGEKVKARLVEGSAILITKNKTEPEPVKEETKEEVQEGEASEYEGVM